MNSLEFINKEIEAYQVEIEHLKNAIRLKPVYADTIYECERGKECQARLNVLQQIKSELEIMELIENGWSSMEQTLSGERIIKFQKLNIDDWLKVWKTLEKFALKKALEVDEND